MSAQLTPEQIRQINEAIFAGHTIEAIKLYREYTGLGLKEAKDFVDAVAAELRKAAPEKFAPSGDGKAGAAGKGCLSVLLCALVPAALVGLLSLLR